MFCVPGRGLMLQVVFGGELQEKGCNFELKVNSAEDLNRYGSCPAFRTRKPNWFNACVLYASSLHVLHHRVQVHVHAAV